MADGETGSGALGIYTVEGGEFLLNGGAAESCKVPLRVSGVFLTEILSATILGGP